ncbi:DUF2125 domain-containing protein [Poseidonocella sp. HB161398]|uniref:DUF2125 domain-containing protein n=1 Tax=Poseidonocella sp. HB161398 TaxID=2320855 RepID=UPI00110987F1|nr:DUF2125 domain-containing protein [Poseidonocella sp. HB161398]
MTRHLPALALLLGSAAPLHADIRPDEVWQQWQDVAAVYGMQLAAAAEEERDGTLTLESVTATLSMGLLGTVSLAIPEIALAGQGGAVAIRYPQPLAVAYSQSADGVAATESHLSLPMDGLEIRATGDGGEIRYRYDVPSLSATGTTETRLTDGGLLQSGTVSALIEKAAGELVLPRGAATGSAEAHFTAAHWQQETLLQDSTGAPAGRQQIAREDFSSEARAIAEGGAFQSFTGQGHAAQTRQVSDAPLPDGLPPISFAYAAENEETRLAAADGRGSFAISADRGDLAVTGVPGFAAPVELQLGANSLETKVPYALSGGPAPVSLQLDAQSLTLGDRLWREIDPDGHVSRDPGTLSLDLGGTVTPPQPGFLPMAVPFGIDAVEIRKLLLSLGGAVLEGQGAFQLETGAEGLPEPVGKMDLSLENGLALLDGLIAAGVIPQEQAFGLRMMLGVVARPDGDGDRLVSEIELEPGRNLVLNGMRMPVQP